MSERARIAIEAAHGARGLLKGVLVELQELALLADASAGALDLAETAAQIMSDLFSLERESHDDAARSLLLGQSLRGLRSMLHALQIPSLNDPRLAVVVEQVAGAVAVLFAASRAIGGVPSYAAGRARPAQVDAREVQSVRPPPVEPRLQPSEQMKPVDREDPRDPSFPLRRPRRAAERVEIDVEVGFATETNFYAGLSMDLSTGGLFVATYKLHEVGTPVMLTFVLPSGHEINATGEVRWVRESASGEVTPGMGIAFTGLAAIDLKAIEAFCRQRLPMYFDEES